MIRKTHFFDQPQAPVGIDCSCPLVEGLTLAMPSPLLPEATGQTELVRAGNLSDVLLGEYGAAAAFGNSASNYFSISRMPAYATGEGYTVFGVGCLIFNANSVFILTCDDGSTRAFQFRISNGGVPQFIVFNTAGTAYTAAGATQPIGVPALMVGRVFGTTVDIWVDGVKGTPATLSGTIKAPVASAMRIGVRTTSASDGHIGSIGMAKRAWTDAEVAGFFENQWHIYRGPSSRMWVDFGSASAGTSLIIANASHGHYADEPYVSASSTLAIDPANHGQWADSVSLSAESTVAIDDATHTHLADALVLSTTGSADLEIFDASHAHAAEALALSAEWLLSVSNAIHVQAADSVSLSDSPYLSISESSHGHMADAIGLSVSAYLSIADAIHGHQADDVSLSSVQEIALVIAEAVHQHMADSLALSDIAPIILSAARSAFRNLQVSHRLSAVQKTKRH